MGLLSVYEKDGMGYDMGGYYGIVLNVEIVFSR